VVRKERGRERETKSVNVIKEHVYLYIGYKDKLSVIFALFNFCFKFPLDLNLPTCRFFK
jgi:hypothetical protein